MHLFAQNSFSDLFVQICLLIVAQVRLFVFVCIDLLAHYSLPDLLVSFAETCSDSFAHIGLFSFVLLRVVQVSDGLACSYSIAQTRLPRMLSQICWLGFVC